MHPTDNEQVFDSTVRELLEIGGIEYLELPPETLLEAISHGEGSEVSALNLIVQAHVAHLMNDVWAPTRKTNGQSILAKSNPSSGKDWKHATSC